jgi:hypothetical protein
MIGTRTGGAPRMPLFEAVHVEDVCIGRQTLLPVRHGLNAIPAIITVLRGWATRAFQNDHLLRLDEHDCVGVARVRKARR